MILATILGTWLTAPAWGRDIYVNNQTGDDTFTGRAVEQLGESGPVRTIAKALRLATRGDRVVLANTGAPYREPIALVGGHHGAGVNGPFRIEGNGAILDGSTPIPPAQWEHFSDHVYRYQPRRGAYQKLFIDDRPLVRRPIDASHPTPGLLEPLEWCLHEGWIYFRVEPQESVYSYNLSCAGLPVGVTMYQVRGAVVANLIVQGFQLDGVNAHDRVEQCGLLNVTCRGNGRAGVAVAGTSMLELQDCTVGDNGHCQVFTSGMGIAVLRDTRLLTKSAPDIISEGGEVLAEAAEAP
jgi:hypothetical protein